MIVPFSEIRSLIPAYIFNEFGQLTGHFVHYDQIVCESGGGRLKIWLNQDAFNEQDPDRLICDYPENDLRGHAS
ncbi:MAG: hypothetical protein AABO57_14960 [Acidobacteriota bacterium]